SGGQKGRRIIPHMSNGAEPQHATLQDLWSEACRLAGALPLMFGEPATIASAGLSRRLALRCCNWLWAAEALVRRLIVAAAMAFDPRKLTRPRPAVGAASVRTRIVSPRPQRFRLFASACCPRDPLRSSSSDTALPYAHMPFPADDLLRLDAPRGPRANLTSPRPQGCAPQRLPRRPNPLHRRGRISRHDPDYRGYANPDRMDPPPGARRPARKRLQGQARAEPPSALHHLPASTEWRRVEQEWERVLPAPHLAARIEALLRVIEKPRRWVVRLA